MKMRQKREAESMKKVWKLRSVIVATLLIFTLITGCAKNNQSPNNGETEVPSATTDPNQPTSILAGVDFEKEIDASRIQDFTGEPVRHQTFTFWANYAEEGLTVDAEKYGEYGMKVIPVHGTYNYVVLDFGEVLPAMSIIDFDVYVDTDGKPFVRDPKDFVVWSVFKGGHGTKETNAVKKEINCWNHVQTILSEESDHVILFFEHRYYADGVIPTLYIDNVRAAVPVT